MPVEWHSVITEGGEVVPVSELPRRRDVAAQLRGVVRDAVEEWARAALDQLAQTWATAFEGMQRAASELAEFFAQFFAQFGAAVVDALRPLAEALRAAVPSWWRSLPPYARSWLHRRLRYGGLPVTGPPRAARFVAPVRRL